MNGSLSLTAQHFAFSLPSNSFRRQNIVSCKCMDGQKQKGIVFSIETMNATEINNGLRKPRRTAYTHPNGMCKI